MGESVTHPNGAQLRVDRIEVFPDSIVVQAELTNGSLFGLRVDRGETRLTGPAGETAELTEPVDVGEIPSGVDVPLVLRFGPLEAETLTLLLNEGGGSSPVNPTTTSPSFQVGPFELDRARTRPALPPPVFLDRTLVHPNGAELQVGGLVFAPTRTGVWVRVANPARFDVTIAARTVAPSLLVDDLGNRYPVMLSDDENALRVAAGTARSGVLSFAGRIHPDASSLTLLLNHRSDQSTEGAGAPYPRFEVRSLSVTEHDRATGLPDPIGPPAPATHANGLTMEVLGLRFADASIEVDVRAANQGSRTVHLAGLPTAVVDDAGNRHPLVPPAEAPSFPIEAGTTVEATLVFSGRVAATAAAVTLQFNQGGPSDDAATDRPAMAFGPFPLVRPADTGPPPEPRLFAVPPTSRLEDDVLVASEVDQVAQTLVQFGAEQTEDGIRLTLPDDVLFDFNSADLRPDAVPTLGLIAEVLRYFEGDPVRIVGHTDSIGSAAYNQELSEARARSVVEALVADHGIPPDRLVAEGRGASEPVAPNTLPDGTDDPAGRQLNRRVEIVVVTDDPIPTG